MELNDVNEKYKENYLDSYFEDLNIPPQEPEWSMMIIRAMEFYDFTDCKSLLEMMEDSKFVFKYKHELERKFEEMLTWFITVKLGITTRPISPHAADNKSVDLLGLYMAVERDGGYQNVTDNMWPVIAEDMGYEYHDGSKVCKRR
ncbi:putative transcription factor & chromatin remodeling ARID family [Helianthus annuus]|nr:putative transcription factor & chromatin remodeling ARID family [Helianthus annuus]